MREPFTHLLYSVWDCFWNPWPSETFRDRLANARGVIHYWLHPDDSRYY